MRGTTKLAQNCRQKNSIFDKNGNKKRVVKKSGGVVCACTIIY